MRLRLPRTIDAPWASGFMEKEGFLQISVQYNDVTMRHARFHMAAAAVVHRVNSGESLSNDLSLGSRSEFAMASVELVRALVKLKEMVNRGADGAEGKN